MAKDTHPKAPRIGIIGGGQLGRMMALDAHRLGLEVHVYEPEPDSPAGQVAHQVRGSFDDVAALTAFGRTVDVVTYEREQLPAAPIAELARTVPVFPSPEALAIAQDRLAEKRLFREVGIPTCRFAPITAPGDFAQALVDVGLPAVLKVQKAGYDGRGQRVVRTEAELASAFAEMRGACVLEELVAFERELSVVAVRDQKGNVAFYPMPENTHEHGILRKSVAPAPRMSAAISALAHEHVRRLLDRLDYVGVLALELFERGGLLLANEMAPRVHNTGHYTMDACDTGQFENHLRAVAGLPLGSTALVRPVVMHNLIGDLPELAEVLRTPGARLHLYGKAARPGRKVGHVTVPLPTTDPAA